MTAICSWHGVSGWRYDYEVHPVGTPFRAVPGNYIFAKESAEGWVPIYIGESESLGDRCCNAHEKWDAAIRYGATHIHCHVNSDKPSRLAEETDLIRAWTTPCNDR